MFSESNVVSVIRINGYNYALPRMSTEEFAMVRDTLSRKGYTVTVDRFDYKVLSVDVQERNIKGHTWIDNYRPSSLVVLQDSYIARVSAPLMIEVGVKHFINAGPRFVRTLSLVMGEDGQFMCTETATESDILEKVTGYVDYDKGEFVSELGSYKYIAK